MNKKISSVLIVGATRGIGLELVKQFLDLKPDLLIATYRTMETANNLKNLADKNSNLKLIKLDVLDFDSYEIFSSQLDQIIGDNGLEILILNAGILIEDKIGSIKQSNMIKAFTTNTIAPILLTQQLLPALQRSSSKKGNAKSVYMSSCLGSICMNDGDRYSHRMSKSALNQGIQTFSRDLKDEKIEFVLLHPGLVKTEMSNFEGDIDVETSVKGMIEVLFSDTLDRNHRLISWNGEIIGW